MKKVISEIIDTPQMDVQSRSKDILNVISYLKSIEIPKKEKKVTVKKEEKIPQIVEIIVPKEYSELEIKWNEIFNKLGGEEHE